MIKVGILDGRPIVRAGLEHFLSGAPDLTFAGHSGDSGEVPAFVQDEGVQVLVCELASTIDMLALLRSRAPDLALLALSDGFPSELVVAAARMGAMGHIQTDARQSEVHDAIRAVATGRRHFPAALLEHLSTATPAPKAPHELLSEREFQVFLKLAQGSSTGDVARLLTLSVKTVTTYRSRLMEKLRLASNSDLTYYALKSRLIQ